MNIEGSDEIYAGPEGTALRFFYRATKNNFQSEKCGRPIFDNSLIVEVMVPGSRESTPEFEVERTFAEEAGTDAQGNRLVERSAKYTQYQAVVEAFKAQNGEGLAAGTPIAQWAQIDTGTAATLKAAGIHTVEMLASVNDGNLQNLGIGGRVLRDQANAFINTRQFGVPTAQMAADAANLREENTRLKGEVEDLTNRLSAATGEVAALRTGQPAPPSSPQANTGMGSNTALNDPLGPGTISRPDPFASLNSESASPLTPTEGEAGDNAKKVAENTGNSTQPPAPLI